MGGDGNRVEDVGDHVVSVGAGEKLEGNEESGDYPRSGKGGIYVFILLVVHYVPFFL